jgi:PadR family transcriptional regulator PadR
MDQLGRITQPVLDVLEVLVVAFDQHQEVHGWAIMKRVGRAGPTVYGVIDRLEDIGWLSARWEEENPQPNRPRRRFYQLNGESARLARTLLDERRPDWTSRVASPPSGRPSPVWRRPGLAGGEP